VSGGSVAGGDVAGGEVAGDADVWGMTRAEVVGGVRRTARCGVVGGFEVRASTETDFDRTGRVSAMAAVNPADIATEPARTERVSMETRRSARSRSRILCIRPSSAARCTSQLSGG
jgi:hypothetical protein